jgi:hypothetical protein
MEMMKSMSMGGMTMPMDMGAMQECIQSLNACSMAATMCAGTDMAMGPEMAKCCAMCSNMADMADATMRMMMRPLGMDMDVMTAMLTACMTMGRVCAAECRMHADMDEMCRYCAMACDDMVTKCEAVLASMA